MMSLTTDTRQGANVSRGSGVAGSELAMPRLLLDDGTIIACLRRFNGSRTVIGRHPSTDLHLTDDPYISDIHADITWDDIVGAHVLHDRGSANGTLLDGARLRRPARLSNGARIRVGRTNLVYCNKLPMPGYVSTLTRRVRAPHWFEPRPQQSGDV